KLPTPRTLLSNIIVAIIDCLKISITLISYLLNNGIKGVLLKGIEVILGIKLGFSTIRRYIIRVTRIIIVNSISSLLFLLPLLIYPSLLLKILKY
ncbi:hypothetical protein OFM35_30855, partial [Escherichia coli]|nr:hypothetical protein [Escherichia coli]